MGRRHPRRDSLRSNRREATRSLRAPRRRDAEDSRGRSRRTFHRSSGLSSIPFATTTHRWILALARLLALVGRHRAAAVHTADGTRHGTSPDGAGGRGARSIGAQHIALRTLLHHRTEGRVRDAAHIRTEVRRERGAEKGHSSDEKAREWPRARGESCASIPLSALSRPTPNRSGVGTRVIRETVIQRGLAVAVGTNAGRAVALEDGTAVRVLHVFHSN